MRNFVHIYLRLATLIASVIFATALADAKLVKSTCSVRDTVIVTENWKYEGQWPEGQGVYQSYRQGIIIGTFKNGVPNGVCYNFWVPTRLRYWGEFCEGKRTGYGRIFRGDEIVAVGDMLNGRQHGVDTIFRADGSILIGVYNKGKFVEAIKEYKNPPKNLRKLRPKFPKIKLTKQQKAFLAEADIRYKEYVRKKREEENASEVKPKFKGVSANAFAEYVNSQLVYPYNAKKNGYQGRTVIRFVVTKEGTMRDIEIVRSSGYDDLDNEAMRVVNINHTSPNWTPGTVNGVETDMELTFPVIFKLP